MSLKCTLGTEGSGNQTLSAAQGQGLVRGSGSSLVKPFYARAINYGEGKTIDGGVNPVACPEILSGSEKSVIDHVGDDEESERPMVVRAPTIVSGKSGFENSLTKIETNLVAQLQLDPSVTPGEPKGNTEPLNVKKSDISSENKSVQDIDEYEKLATEIDKNEISVSEMKPEQLDMKKSNVEVEPQHETCTLKPKKFDSDFDTKRANQIFNDNGTVNLTSSLPADTVLEFGLDPKILEKWENSVRNIRKEIEFSDKYKYLLELQDRANQETDSDHYEISRVLHRKIDLLQNKFEKHQSDSWDLGQVENEKENELSRLREQVTILISEKVKLKSQIQSRETLSANIFKEFQNIRELQATFNQKLDNLKKGTSKTFQTLSNTLRKFHTECMQAIQERGPGNLHLVGDGIGCGPSEMDQDDLVKIIKDSMTLTEKLIRAKRDITESKILKIGYEAENKVNRSMNLIESLDKSMKN